MKDTDTNKTDDFLTWIRWITFVPILISINTSVLLSIKAVRRRPSCALTRMTGMRPVRKYKGQLIKFCHKSNYFNLWRFVYFWNSSLNCTAGNCQVVYDNVLFFRDQIHYAHAAANLNWWCSKCESSVRELYLYNCTLNTSHTCAWALCTTQCVEMINIHVPEWLSWVIHMQRIH